VNDLITLFVSTTEASIAALKRGIAQGDLEACRKEAHALKGAAASVTARAIQDAAARIETCLRDSDFPRAAAELSTLENTFHARA
jgi:HPt (histidine-containing phosphotransfer) domain-containing protein